MGITCYGFLFVFQCSAPVAPIVVCPHVTGWSRAYQVKLADEVGRLPEGSATARAMQEHLQLRDRARKCLQLRPQLARAD